MKLTSNNLLITGATSGIGFALTEKFLALGNKVIGVGRKTEPLVALQAKYPNLAIFTCDIANPIEFDKLVSYCKQTHADLNVLINNAGIQSNYDWLQEPNLHTKIDEEIRLNFTIPLQLTAALLPILRQQPQAAIVNVSSGLGIVPKQTAPVYCGTKAGLHMTTKALRYQLEQTNINVFEIIPPLVATPMTEGMGKGKIQPDELVAEFLRGFENDRYEMSIGKVKLLRFINRLFPALADKIMKKGL